jgi:formylglycine-generating enzyme required for sulfatase activity
MVPVRPDTLWMSQFEFSVGQWFSIKGEPYDEAQAHMPMSNVSFGEVLLFLSDVGDMTNLNITLPSVDEWEYAAQGGSFHETTTYVGSDTPDPVAWYKDNAGGHAHPSDGQQGKEPNTLDLYDMSGNISAWCNTPYGDNGLYTVCGGNYQSSASEVTTVSRKGMDANSKEPTVGFRIVIKKQ